MNLIQSELSDLFAAIEMGWAKPVNAATHIGDQIEYRFYTMAGVIYLLEYVKSNTVTYGSILTGENRDMFISYYGIKENAA